MPEYIFVCEECKKDFSVFKSIKDYTPKERCIYCKSKNTHRNYEGSRIFGSVPKTLGHFLDLNGDRLSEDEKRHIKEKARKDEN